MDGKQQAPQKETHKEKEPCMCSKDHLHESNGCSKCCCQDWPHVVSVSVLQEIPPNKRKRNKAFGIIKTVAILFLFMFWEIAALTGAIKIFDENIFDDAFLTIANFSFVAISGWFLFDVILDKFGIIE